jgi:hypothetical protein
MILIRIHITSEDRSGSRTGFVPPGWALSTIYLPPLQDRELQGGGGDCAPYAALLLHTGIAANSGRVYFGTRGPLSLQSTPDFNDVITRVHGVASFRTGTGFLEEVPLRRTERAEFHSFRLFVCWVGGYRRGDCGRNCLLRCNAL